MIKKKVGFGLAIATLMVAATASAATYWTGWVSEESGGPATGCSQWNEAANGAGCQGSYCDKVRLQCTTAPFGVTIEPDSVYWSGFFSEEHDQYSTWHSEGWYHYEDENYHVCHSWDGQPGFVTAIRCSGSYCDNISIECGQASLQYGQWGPSFPVSVTNCSWSGWYSEEQGSVNFGTNRYITGVECNGSRCDNKRYYVCSMIDPTPVFEG